MARVQNVVAQQPSSEHILRAQSTYSEHRVWNNNRAWSPGSEHRAQSTEHRAQSTEHRTWGFGAETDSLELKIGAQGGVNQQPVFKSRSNLTTTTTPHATDLRTRNGPGTRGHLRTYHLFSHSSPSSISKVLVPCPSVQPIAFPPSLSTPWTHDVPLTGRRPLWREDRVGEQNLYV